MSKSKLVAWSVVVSALVVLTSGCINLEPQGNPTQYYVLGGAWEGSDRQAEGLSVGLRELDLAAYLESPRIVVREGPHGVRFAEYHRWGESLNRGINRTVAGYLLALPATSRVDVVPWRRHIDHDAAVKLNVLRFEGVVREDVAAAEQVTDSSNGEVHVLIDWEIADPSTDEVLATGRTDYRETGWRIGDYSELAVMLDAGLEVLAADLDARLRALAR